MYCWICGDFSAYASYLELVCAVNGLLGAWWGNLRQRWRVNRESERNDQETLLEKGSDAKKKVTDFQNKRDEVDKQAKFAGLIFTPVIVVLILASLLFINPSMLVPASMKFVLVILPTLLPAFFTYAALRDFWLRHSINRITLKVLSENKLAESKLLSKKADS